MTRDSSTDRVHGERTNEFTAQCRITFLRANFSKLAVFTLQAFGNLRLGGSLRIEEVDSCYSPGVDTRQGYHKLSVPILSAVLSRNKYLFNCRQPEGKVRILDKSGLAGP